MLFLFLDEKLLDFGSQTPSRFFTVCCLSHFSYFSDFAVLFLGVLEQLKYRPAVDHSGPSECRDGSVWWFQITRLQGLHLFPEGAASVHRRWHSSYASSLDVPFVNRQSPYKAGRQQKCWYSIVIPWLFSKKTPENTEKLTQEKKIQPAYSKNLIVARPCRICKDVTIIITVAGGTCASSKTASGIFWMLQREPKTHCVRTKCCSSRKMFWERDLVLIHGKLFTQQAERMKL